MQTKAIARDSLSLCGSVNLKGAIKRLLRWIVDDDDKRRKRTNKCRGTHQAQTIKHDLEENDTCPAVSCGGSSVFSISSFISMQWN